MKRSQPTKQRSRKKAASPVLRRKAGVLRGGLSPDVGKATQFKPGQSGNPGGRPRQDLAQQIARAIFEEDYESICKALSKKLRKGDIKAFDVVGSRAYGTPIKKVQFEEIISGDPAERLRELLAAAAQQDTEQTDE